MNGNDSAWTSVKGRSQVKQNSQKIKTTTNGHQGTLNSNNFLPTASKTTVPNGNVDAAKSVEYASNSNTALQNAAGNNHHNVSNGRNHNSHTKSNFNNVTKNEAKPQRNGFAASSGDPRKSNRQIL
uniref:Uncharacterized protein n=1 Tax=Romanomermis culicivorax TaxID=13658 RepID=A0A915J2H8_ROMCU